MTFLKNKKMACNCEYCRTQTDGEESKKNREEMRGYCARVLVCIPAELILCFDFRLDLEYVQLDVDQILALLNKTFTKVS